MTTDGRIGKGKKSRVRVGDKRWNLDERSRVEKSSRAPAEEREREYERCGRERKRKRGGETYCRGVDRDRRRCCRPWRRFLFLGWTGDIFREGERVTGEYLIIYNYL